MTDNEKIQNEKRCKIEACGLPIAFNNLCPFHAHAPAHLFAYVTQVLNANRDYKNRIIEARQLSCYDPPITENEKNAVYAAVLFLAKRNKLPNGATTANRDAVIAQLDLSPVRNPKRIWVESEHVWYSVSWVAMAYENTLMDEVYALAQQAYDRGDEINGATKQPNAPVYDRDKQTQFDHLGNRITKTYLFGGAQ